MERSRETVALSRLIRRETFYKEKALRIEKDLIFANEIIGTLEARIEDLTKEESEQKEAEIKELQSEIEGLHAQIEDLTKRLEEESVQYNKRETELLSEVEELKQIPVKEQIDPSFSEKIEAYERLLTDIQVTINEKEREVIIYKARLDLLERRIKQQSAFADLDNIEVVSDRAPSHTHDLLAISYIEHAIILSAEDCLIRGECVIENVGTQILDTPLICLRINPLDVVHIKGKIQTGQMDEDTLVEGMELTWSLIQNDWAKEAREREELWITPNRPINLEPGEVLRVPDIQLSINRKYCERVTIEGFIYFKKSEYKIKMVNPIIINF